MPNNADVKNKNPPSTRFSVTKLPYSKPVERKSQSRENERKAKLNLPPQSLVSADLKSIEELDSLEMTKSPFQMTSEDSVECLDVGLSNAQRTVCFHCCKVLDFFLKRNQTITFPSLEITGRLHKLRTYRMSYWSAADVDFLVEIYKNGPSKRQKQFESIDQLMWKHEEDILAQGMKKYRYQGPSFFAKMTKASLSR